MVVALIPLRNGRRLVPRSNLTPTPAGPVGTLSPLPFLPLLSPSTHDVVSTSSSSYIIVVVGRRELLTCYWKACGCDDDLTTSRNKCEECQRVNQWAVSALSRQMLQFQIVPSENGESAAIAASSQIRTQQPQVRLWIRGRHVRSLLHFHPTPAATLLTKPTSSLSNNASMVREAHDVGNDWLGPWILSLHTILNFRPSSLLCDDGSNNTLSFALVHVDPQTGEALLDYDPTTMPQIRTVTDAVQRPKTAIQLCNVSALLPNSTGVIDTVAESGDYSAMTSSNKPQKQQQQESMPRSTSNNYPLTEKKLEESSSPRLASAEFPCQVTSCPDNNHMNWNHMNRNNIEALVESELSPTSLSSLSSESPPEPPISHDDDDNGDGDDSKCNDYHGDDDRQCDAVNYHDDEDHSFLATQEQQTMPPPENVFRPSPRESENDLVSLPSTQLLSSSAVPSNPDSSSSSGIHQFGADGKMTSEKSKGLPASNSSTLMKSQVEEKGEEDQEKEKEEGLNCGRPAAIPTCKLLTVQPVQAAHDESHHNSEVDTELQPIQMEQQKDASTVTAERTVQADTLTSLITADSINHVQLGCGALQKSHPITVLAEHPPPENQQQQDRPVVYFVRRGGLSQKRIQLLANHAKNKGAVVIDQLSARRNNNSRISKAPIPTHLVMEPSTSVTALLAEVQLPDQDSLRDWLQQNGIQCVTTAWITKGNSLELPPSPTSRWYKLSPARKRQRTLLGNDQGDPPQPSQHDNRKKRRPGSRPATPSLEDDDDRAVNRDGGVLSSPVTSTNVELSELFQKLSQLHQSCPLLTEDTWKSYSFRVTAGRLRRLDFVIRNDPAVLSKVRQVRGFGDSALRMIQEYLSTGTFQRIKAFEADPDRVAMKRMMGIWGVGRVKALELLRQGYKDIAQVRKGLKSGKLVLDRNQRIGVECYEDILEEMSRSEVEKIGSIVAEAAQEVAPGVEVMIMGSYRRGKPACGDVDVFLTHKDHFDRIPPSALGMIVDKLRLSGHVAYHLTHLVEMKSTDDMGSRYWSNKPPDKEISTYFGVFHSPVVSGRRRRVDIKFFPYRERAFAALYFTGNGFFNRSIRLWASRKFQWLLNEKGLYTRDMRTRVMEADSERQVFEKLHLVYKEPHERDGFDAVEPADRERGTSVDEEITVTRADINRDEKEHRWID